MDSFPIPPSGDSASGYHFYNPFRNPPKEENRQSPERFKILKWETDEEGNVIHFDVIV